MLPRYGCREKIIWMLFFIIISSCHNRGVFQWQSGTMKAERNQRCSSGRRGQPAAFPTTFLSHPSFSFFFFFFPPPPAPGPSRRTALDKQQETKALISPLNLVEIQCCSGCENKCQAATVGAGWKGGSVAARSCCSLDSVQQALGLCFSCDLIKGDGWAPSELLSGGTRRLFRGSDKMEQLLHTFVFFAGERFAK